MSAKQNSDRPDLPLTVARDDAEGRVQEPLYGAITGRIAIGRYVLQIGEASGAVVREASRIERAHIRPRPTPVLLRPKLIRGLVDRRMELAAAFSALDAGLPVEISGEPGIGKTAILRHLAHHPRATSFVDGIVYLSARHQPAADLLQIIFEAFYESDEICKPTETEIRRGLQEKLALILLDDVQLTQHELERVLDIAPRSAFAVATRERCLWGEVRSLALKGLPAEDALSLLEREIDRPLDDSERAEAAEVCEALGGHPLHILQAAAIARLQGISFGAPARTPAPGSLVRELIASVDERQRRALLALAALPGVPLPLQHVSGLAEVPDIESALLTLVRCGLVVSSQSRHRLASGVADQLRRTEDLKPWVNRAITYFTAWAERYRRSPASLLEESEALLCVQECATEARRWGEVLRLGRLFEGALVVGARWGASAIALERCLAAARALGDRSAEAWALHESGSRAICLGEPTMARALLTQAMKLREAMDDQEAAAVSRRNLTFVLAPVAETPPERASGQSAGVLDFDSLPLRDATRPAIRRQKANGAGVVLFAALLSAILGGLAYLSAPAGLRWNSWNVASIGAFLESGLGGATAAPAATPQTLPPAAEPRVMQFSAVPERITPGESVRLCYEIANGTDARIEPDVGEVGVLHANCVSAMPVGTTTYELTAHGSGGESVQQTARVVVDSDATGGSEPEELESPPLTSGVEPPAGTPLDTPEAPEEAPNRASILIFTPRPGSIATGDPMRLCYAVSGALRARVEPGIGEVEPASTLTCLRVAPACTTTYELIASGKDGHQVRQQLVIIVR